MILNVNHRTVMWGQDTQGPMFPHRGMGFPVLQDGNLIGELTMLTRHQAEERTVHVSEHLSGGERSEGLALNLRKSPLG